MTPASKRRLEIVVDGDRRLAEEVIVELRALAEQLGLEAPDAAIVSRRPPRRGGQPKSGR